MHLDDVISHAWRTAASVPAATSARSANAAARPGAQDGRYASADDCATSSAVTAATAADVATEQAEQADADQQAARP